MRQISLLCLFFTFATALVAQTFPALELNGTTGFVQIPNTLNFGTAQDFSLEIRVKTAGWTADPAILSDKDWDAGKNKGFVISGNTNGQTWKFNIGDGTNRIDLNNGGLISDDLWHTLTVTFDRDGAKRIYQDGRMLQTSNTLFTGDITSPLPNLGIGQHGTLAYITSFAGSVAEVRIWEVALDSATVASWTCKEVNNAHPNFNALAYYWAFAESTGSTTTDAVAGAVGALSNGASWATGAFATPIADFSALSTGLNVDFANTSTSASLYSWQFGDGAVSALAAPSHLYAQPGTYTVQLIAQGACENDTIVKSVTVVNGTTTDNLPGAGRALDFDGQNDYVLIPTNPVLKPTNAMTLESWINVRSFDTEWETVLSFAQDNGGSESGYDLAFVNEKLRFRCKTATMSSGEWDSNPGADVRYNEWVHIAGVYDGAEIRFYLNGVLQEAQPKTGAINWQFAPVDFRIGAYHDDNEDYFFDGQIDEVRVWNVARTEDELRQKMCSKLLGTENGLVGYWRFDEAAGNTAKNRTANMLDGTLTNMAVLSDRVTSGAAIGEQSNYLYTTDWAGMNIGMVTPVAGTFEVANISGNPSGIQIYRVDTLAASSIPNHVFSLTGDYHWGVFPTDATAQYDLIFDYSGNAFANQFEPLIGYGIRTNGAASQWTALTGNLDETNDVLVRPEVGASHEIFLASADFTAICPFQGVFVATNIGFSSMSLEWSSVQNLSSIQWGTAGFQLGNGTQVDQIMGATYDVTGLESNTLYDFYVLDTCPLNQLPGIWFGPYSYRTSSCVAPATLNVEQITSNSATLTWDTTNGSTYDLQWGPGGFDLGLGIQYPNVGAPYLLDGLAVNKSYDVYIRSVCGSAGESEWIGPVTFTTLLVGTEDPSAENAALVYPNPAKSLFYVQAKNLESLRLLNLNDQPMPISQRRINENTVAVEINAAQGIYFLEISSRESKVLRKVVLAK